EAAWRPGEWVLAADTLVVVEEQVLGKPVDREEAGQMLAALAGKEHEVVTGFLLLGPVAGLAREGCVTTRVRFDRLSAEAIAAYLDSGEPFGKAGAYAIQGIGAALVREIRGSYTNVVGLPLCEVLEALRAAGALAGSPLARGVPALEDAP
ncbi:MAG: Maf-like protein, partial [Deltaproteobacteria bacterium]|nr:Maf-like protein [Deltaproteobacteria bacterium]